jgi:hypothetical protein
MKGANQFIEGVRLQGGPLRLPGILAQMNADAIASCVECVGNANSVFCRILMH